MSEIITKSEFATLTGVSPGRVSQWIAEGKLTGEALVGEGRSARINVSVASEQLRLKLDINQRFGLNGLTTALPSPLPASSVQGASTLPFGAPRTSQAAAAGEDPIEFNIKAQKLRQAELITAKAEREDREARGIYVRTDDAKAEMARIAGTLFSIFEGAISDFSNAMAGKFELSVRDVQYALQQEFLAVRKRAAAKLEKELITIPEIIADDEPETDIAAE